MPLGYRVACTLVNQTASLTLLRTSSTTTAVPPTASAWNLTATPATLTGLTPTTVVGSETSVPASTFQVRPVHVYTLTESTVAGYQFAKLQQFVSDALGGCRREPQPLGYPKKDGSGNWQITVGGLDMPVYRFVNDDVAPHADPRQDGHERQRRHSPADRLDAHRDDAGGPNLTGTTGTALGDQPAGEGGCRLHDRRDRPAAYDWTTLSCGGLSEPTPASPTLTLAPGDDVTCTLNNDDILVPVTIAKADGVVSQVADGIGASPTRSS